MEEAWHAESATGAAAIRDGQVVGYLIGAPLDAKIWGQNVWVGLAGHAVEEPEDLRDLYAAAAERWVEDGRRRQYALVPAGDPALVEAWYRVGFGQQHAHGLQEIERREVVLPDAVEIRTPATDEIEELIEVDLTLPTHQGRSPVFSDIGQPSRDELREEWVDTLAGDEEEVLVAYRNGKPLAVWSVMPLEVSKMHKGLGRPERAAFIGFAATLPEAQGSGLGLALTDASFNWAAEHGYEVMVTDWRVTNLLVVPLLAEAGLPSRLPAAVQVNSLGDTAATAVRDARRGRGRARRLDRDQAAPSRRAGGRHAGGDARRAALSACG